MNESALNDGQKTENAETGRKRVGNGSGMNIDIFSVMKDGDQEKGSSITGHFSARLTFESKAAGLWHDVGRRADDPGRRYITFMTLDRVKSHKIPVSEFSPDPVDHKPKALRWFRKEVQRDYDLNMKNLQADGTFILIASTSFPQSNVPEGKEGHISVRM